MADELAFLTPYSALSTETSTRLVILHPGHWDDFVQCSFREVDLEDTADLPKFSAVSYEWGPCAPDRPHLIDIDGAIITVRPNLYNCLRQLRKRLNSSPCPLWIDQLSINQQDDVEKDQQLAMMGRIYSQADEVIAWVGEHHHGSELLFRDLRLAHRLWLANSWSLKCRRVKKIMFEEILAAGMLSFLALPYLRRSIAHLILSRGLETSVRVAMLTVLILLFIILGGMDLFYLWIIITTWRASPCSQEFIEICSAWKDFVQRPYWSRHWIVQEVALAERVTIHCGADSVDWPELMQQFNGFAAGDTHIFRRFKYGGLFLPRRIESYTGVPFLHSVRKPCKHQENYSLNNLIMETAYTECTQAKDRIYALLALVPPNDRVRQIRPDRRITYMDLILRAVVPGSYEDREPLCESLQLSKEQKQEVLWRWQYPDVPYDPRISVAYVHRRRGRRLTPVVYGSTRAAFQDLITAQRRSEDPIVEHELVELESQI